MIFYIRIYQLIFRIGFQNIQLMQNQISTSRFNWAKIKKWIIIISIVLGVSLFFFTIYLISSSYIVTLSLFIIILIKFGRIIGRALMFPASFKYYKGNVQMMYANQLLIKITNSLETFQNACNRILKKQALTNNLQINVAVDTIVYFIELEKKLERDNLLTAKKKEFYNKVKQLNQYYTQNIVPFQNTNITLKDYFNNTLNNINQSQLKSIDIQIFKVRQTIATIRQILKQFENPSSFFKSIYYQVYGEKFYEMKYAMYDYDQKYNYKQYKVKTFDDTELDCIIIYNLLSKSQIKNKETVIFCNPNGCVIQTLPFQSGYIDFYLRKNYNVCLWNYRGCGYSTGTPSLSNNQKDVLQIYDFLLELNQKPTITHGYSIGGPTAVYLCSKRSLNTLIADRTLFCLDQLAIDYGKILTNLMKILFFRDRKDYSKLFYNILHKKIIIYDPYDEIIKNRASMKSGVASHMIKEIKESEINILNDQSSAHSLFSKFYTMFKKQKIKNSIADIDFLSEEFIKSFALNTAKFISQQSRRKPYFFNRTLSDFQQAQRILIEQCTQQFLQEKITQDSFQKPINKIIEEVNNILEYLDGAGLRHFITNTKYAISLQKQRLIKQIELFFYGMVTYGSFVQLNYGKMDPENARINSIIKLATIIKSLKVLEIKYQEQQINIKIITKIRQQFSKIAIFMKQNLKNEIYRKVGYLLPVRCGHNGNLNYQQFQYLSEFIQKNTNSEFQFIENDN